MSSTAVRTPMPRSVLIVGVWVPLVIGLVATVLQLVWVPDLPDPLATHWGASDVPDGFSPPLTVVVMSAVLAIGFPLLFAVILRAGRGSAPTATHKLLAATSLWVTVLLATTLLGSSWMQLGLTDAREAGGVTGWLLAGMAGGLVLAVLSWWVMPKAVPAVSALGARIEPLTLAPGERGVWLRPVALHPGAAIALLVGAVITEVITTIITIATGGEAWPLMLIGLLVLVLGSLATAWKVRVDHRGLSVRSRPFGFPRVTIPADDIAEVETVEIDALGEFGGYGWRWAVGRGFGVITRSGEALEVVRHDGRRFVVTVDDAATGAALLAAVASAATPDADPTSDPE